MRDDSTGSESEAGHSSPPDHRRPLHMIQFIAGLIIVPLAVRFFMHGDTRGAVLMGIVAIIAITYAGMNLFVRRWP